MSKPPANGPSLALASQKRCANPACTTAQSNKDTPMWRKGWISEEGDQGSRKALCNPCGLLYSRGWFCNWCHGVYRRIDKGEAKAEYWLPCDYCPNWVHLQCEKDHAPDALTGPHFACYSCREIPAQQRRLQRNVTVIPLASGCKAGEVKDGLRSAYSRPFLHPDVAPVRRVTSAVAPARTGEEAPSAPPTNSNKRARKVRATAADAAHVMQAMATGSEDDDDDGRPSAPSRAQARPAAGKHAVRSGGGGGAKRRRVTISRKAAEAADAEAAFLLAQQRQVHVRARDSLSAYSTPALGNHPVARLFNSDTPMTGSMGGMGGIFADAPTNTHHGLQMCATAARFAHSPPQEVVTQAEELLAGAMLGDAGAAAQGKGKALTLYAGGSLRITSTPERARAACAVDAVRKRIRARGAAPDKGGPGAEALQSALQTAAAKRAALASAPMPSSIMLKPTPVRLSRPRSAFGMGLGPRQIHDDPALETPPSLGCAKCRYCATGCRACRPEGRGHIGAAAAAASQKPRITKARKPRGGPVSAPALPSGGSELWDLHASGAAATPPPHLWQGMTPCFLPFEASPFYAGLISSVDGEHPDDVLVAQPGLALWREQSSPTMAALAVGSTPFFTDMHLHSPGATPGGGAAIMGSPGVQLFRHSPMSGMGMGMGSPLGTSRLFGGIGSAFMATSPRGAAMGGLWGISPPSPVMSPTATGAGTGGSWARRLGGDDPMG